ncbi:MAG: hypothetical protein WDZ59_00600 [Pirellulales bacterium]
MIQLVGYHFHNEGNRNTGPDFVRNEFVEKLRTGSVMLPTGPGGQEQEVTLAELGISHPIVVEFTTPTAITLGGEAAAAQGRPPAGQATAEPDAAGGPIEVRICKFLVQFCWKPTPPSQRAVNRQQAAALQTASN